jgi:hypothetical protein
MRDFDNLIGRLDRVISELMIHRDNLGQLDAADLQTLKHHAEDMAGAGASILRALGGEAKAEAKAEAKIGDRVRVTAESHDPTYREDATLGYEGILGDIDTEDPKYQITCPGDRIVGWAEAVEVIT